MDGLPTPGEHHLRLHRLAGTWEGPESISPSPFGPGGPASGRTVFSIAAGGLFVVGDYEERKEGRVVFRGHSVFGVDPGSGETCWYWFDSMGAPPPGPSRGRWDGDRLVLRSRFPQGEGRYTYELLGSDAYRFVLETSRDGSTFHTAMTGEYRRVG